MSSSGTNGCLSSIQAAVSAAAPGAVISVQAGTYTGSVTVSSSLHLLGAGAMTTTINAAGKDNVVHIAADNVWLEGFTLTGSRLDGVRVNGNNTVIRNNTITGDATLVVPPAPGGPPVPSAWNGLNLQNASGALVQGNDVSNNAGRGIRTEGSALYNFPDQGIMQRIEGRSDHNLILDNTVRNNQSACGIVLSTDSSDNIVEGNTVTGNPAGIVFSTLPPFGLPTTPFAAHIPHSDSNVVLGNTVENNIGLGIDVDAKTGADNGSIVTDNTVDGNSPSGESSGKTVGIQVVGTAPGQVDGTLIGANTVSNQDLDAWVANDVPTNTLGIGSTAPAPAASSLPAATASAPAPSGSQATAVTIASFTYHPDPITVSVGSTVTWTNSDTAQHSATAEDARSTRGCLRRVSRAA